MNLDEFEQHSVLFRSGLCLFFSKSRWLRWLPILSARSTIWAQFPPQFHAHNIINLRQANFLLCYNSTTNGVMWEWISQLDSAHQIGPETTLKVFLMVVGSWSAVG